MNRVSGSICALLLALPVLWSAPEYPPTFGDARAEVYKTVGEVRLSLHVFEPPAEKIGPRPAIVFFFGGSWRRGSPAQFEHHCRHLASRGMVAIAADYRVASRHGVKAVACVEDAKSAVRYVRTHARRLGVDPDRIAAAGGSAGGHLAAATATIAGFDGPGEDIAVRATPDALVLYNPALVLAELEGLDLAEFAERVSEERMGAAPGALSPAHHVKPDLPPTIIFHGTADTTVPFSTAQAFTRLMLAAGNRCELVAYEGESHGFFNYGRDGGENFRDTLARTDRFLVSLGWISAASADASDAAPRD